MKKFATFVIILFVASMSFNVFAVNLPVNQPHLYCKALGPHTMELSWIWQENGKQLPTKLELFRKTPGYGKFKYHKDCPISKTKTSIEDTGLQPDTKYMYKLKIWYQDSETNHDQFCNQTHCTTKPEPEGDTSIRCDCSVTNIRPGTKVRFEVKITTNYNVTNVIMHFDNGENEADNTGSKNLMFEVQYNNVGTYHPWVEVMTDKSETKTKRCCTIIVEQQEKTKCYMILTSYKTKIMSEVVDDVTKYFVHHEVIPGNYNSNGNFHLYKAVYSLKPVRGDEQERNEFQIYGLYKEFEPVEGAFFSGDNDFFYDDKYITEETLTIYIWKWICGECEDEWVDFGGYQVKYSEDTILLFPSVND